MQLDFFARLTARVAAAFQPVRAKSQNPTASSDATELCERAREALLALGYGDLARRLEVRWNARMRSTAGMAFPAKALITLNPRLREFGDEEIERTWRHELAHLLAHHRAGRRRISAHGREWRQACVDLGLPGERRCHDLPLPRRRVERRHIYRCPGCGTEVRRAKPFRRTSACLACCRTHARGRYDERFKFVRVKL